MHNHPKLALSELLVFGLLGKVEGVLSVGSYDADGQQSCTESNVKMSLRQTCQCQQ